MQRPKPIWKFGCVWKWGWHLFCSLILWVPRAKLSKATKAQLISESRKWSEDREGNINGPTGHTRTSTRGRPTWIANLSRRMNTQESDFVNRDGFEQPNKTTHPPKIGRGDSCNDDMKWIFLCRNGENGSWIDSKNVEVSCRQPTRVNQDNNPQSQKTPREPP